MAEAATAAFKTSDHAEVLSRDGSNYQFKCHHCDKVFNGTATRVLGHISGMGGNISACTQVSTEEKAAAVAYKLSCEAATAARKRQRKEDEQLIGKVHRFNFDVSEHLQGNFSSDDAPMPAATIRAVRQIWESRWEQMHSPVHGAAYCLDPQFWEDDGLVTGGGDACVEDLFTMIDKMLPDEEDQQAARLSYSSFRTKEKQFGRPSAVKDAPCMPAHQWWELYGQAHPQLQKVAVRLLSQPASACSCERNWSAYDFIHNRRRNRLTADRARKLVYVFTNGRLVNKLATSEETFIGWDEGVEDGSPLEGDEEGT